MEDHTVAVTLALDVGGQVEADGSVPDGVHRLGIEEVVRPSCGKDTNRLVRERRETFKTSWRHLNQRGQPWLSNWSLKGLMAEIEDHLLAVMHPQVLPRLCIYH